MEGAEKQAEADPICPQRTLGAASGEGGRKD